jgi:hypothetical protein
MLDFGAIEFKVRSSNEYFRNAKWEDTAVHFTLVHGVGSVCDNYDEERKIAQAVAKLLAETKGEEVRWNYRGSSQGHYVFPDKIVEVTE